MTPIGAAAPDTPKPAGGMPAGSDDAVRLDQAASLRARFSSSAFMNSSVVSHGASARDEQREVLGHLAALDGVDETCSSVLANSVTAGVPSSLPRWARPRVQAKIDAIGLVEVFSPFCHCR